MNRHKRHIIGTKNKRGSALIFALGMLAIFVTLGTIYVREMTLELEKANYGMAKTHARTAAQSGVNATLADIEVAVREGTVWNLVGRAHTYQIPVYKQTRDGASLVMEKDENRIALAQVVVSDESGKININHAPTHILQAALGIDEATARNIRGALPRGNAELDRLNNRRWFNELEELVERGILTPEQFAQVNRDWVTTYTVADHANPGRHLNVNTAPGGVLQILFNLSIEEAEKLAVQRPFDDFTALKTAIGKDPSTFNIPMDKNDPSMLPEPLRLESRCFRLKSDAYHARVVLQREYQRVSAYAEAIVLFGNDGQWSILAWSGRRGVEDTI